MRLALAFVVLACAGSAAAEPVQDRYGPPRKATAPQARPYEGRLLGWAGKAAPQAPQPAPAQLAARPEPQRLAREFRAAAPAPARVAAAAPQPPPVPAGAMADWSADPLPQSLYDTPATAPPPPAPRLAQAPPPPEPRQQGAAPSRLYSLHREYGMAPDVVPATPSRTSYVLIGPPDAPAEAETDEAPARKPAVDARLF
ncbi:hypothetical protein ACFODL_17460 [Phenylobacterium terrae]|uniref:hypothetical protein n=1 Tax=Phenylobacterium terrae TaxID=2665495 RepID=UPI00361B6D46